MCFYFDRINDYPVDYLYCIAEYPADICGLEISDVYFEEGRDGEYKEFSGFSDHTIGLDCAKIALARGAEIIEKHFCIDHQTGIDAEWSMDLSELRELKRWHDLCREVL